MMKRYGTACGAGIRMMGLILAAVGPARAADFSSAVLAVNVTLNGNTVTSSVTDPISGQVKTDSITTPGVVSTPEPSGGVVAWLAGSTVHYRIYDVVRGAWMIGNANTPGATLAPDNANGVVAWSAGATTPFVHARVYDPVRGLWMSDSTASASTVNDVKTAGGIVAWASGVTVYYRTYDVAAGQWRGSSRTSPGAPGINDLNVADGVVAWSANGVVFCRTYDHGAGAWREVDVPAAGFISAPAINAGTVTWTAGSTPYTRGYNFGTGAWAAAQTLPYSFFSRTASSNNAPLVVWFIDLSLGGNTWSWNFMDGSPASNRRSPYHQFTTFGRFNVGLTVNGPAGSHTTNGVVLTDIGNPSGSVVINGGAQGTRTTNVTLALSASDNSGAVATMRFSNNGTTWSPYESFATTKAWGLSAGDGTKTVYVQFRDAALNVSATVTDTIQLDTGPVPTVSFQTTNALVAEAGSPVTLMVTIGAAKPYPVSIFYSTQDGLALAGLDYTARSGRLDFAPGETGKSISITLSNDMLVEVNETFQVVLSDPTNAVAGAAATVSILDDDVPAVSLASGPATVDEPFGPAVVTAMLNAASGRTVTVHYATANGSALEGRDYVGVLGEVKFLPGQTTRTIEIPILDDATDEPDETLQVRIHQPTNAILGAVTNASVVIRDDDVPPASFGSSSFVTNENSGGALISVVLGSAFHQTVTVDYQTENGTAEAGSDFQATAGTLIFSPAQTNRTFLVPVVNDGNGETIETVTLKLTGYFNATPGAVTTATLFLVDNASPPSLLAPVRLADRSFQFQVLSPTGHVHAIQVTTNLDAWMEIGRVTNNALSVPFRDASATNSARRIYRAQRVP